MEPRQAIEALSRTLDGRGALAALESRRFVRDLERVALRLHNGDYEKSPFEDNVLNLPDRTHQVMVEVEFMAAVGRAWSRLLGPLGIAEARRVIDLGPGWAPKVEMGLYYSGYSGALVMVNQDAGAIDTLQRFMTLLDTRFTMEVACEDLFTWTAPPADFVLANHLLDDLVLDRYCRRSGTDPGALYARETAFVEAWREILAGPVAERTALVAALADVCRRLVAPGGHVAFVQYPSYAERTLALTEVVAYSRSMLRELGAALVARGMTELSAHAAAMLDGGPGPFFGEHCAVARAPA